jgi:uncharacterized OB-fold protein
VNKKDHLKVLRCRSCGLLHIPPKILCNLCGEEQLYEHPVDGRGSIFSFTTVHVCSDRFKDQLPYDLAIVKLDEGIKVTARLIKTTDAPVKIGALVNFEREDEYGAWFRML